MTDFKALHEELISLVEKTIDPSFRDYLNKTAARQRELYTQGRDTAAANYDKAVQDNNDWAKKDALDAKNYYEKALKGKMNSELIYKELAKYIDVNNATIVKIAVDDTLKSSKLRKELKKYLTDTNIDGVLLVPNVPYYINSKNLYKYDIDALYSFDAYRVYLGSETGKLYIDPIQPYQRYKHPFSKDAKPANSFMSSLNNGIYTGDFYFAYGENIGLTRKKKGRMYYGRSEEEIYGPNYRDKKRAGTNGYDKSGYYKDTQALLDRLAQYKQSKGVYKKDVDTIYSAFDTILQDYKDAVQQYDPRKKDNISSYDLRNKRQKVENASFSISALADALENNDGPRIKQAIEWCKRDLKLN